MKKKSKKVLSIIILIIGIITTLIGIILTKNINTFNYKIINYEEIDFYVLKTKKQKEGYENVIILNNKSLNKKNISNLILNFYDNNNNLLENIIIEVNDIYANEKKEIIFNSKNNLENYADIVITEYSNKYLELYNYYKDNILEIKNNIDKDEHKISITNMSKKIIKIEYLEIIYYNQKFEYIVSNEVEYIVLKPNEETQIILNNFNIKDNDMKYFKIENCDYSEILEKDYYIDAIE